MARKKKALRSFEKSFLWRNDLLYNSPWMSKFYCKFMKNGRKYLVEKYLALAFVRLKFHLEKLPGSVILEQIQKFRPVLSYVNRRMGRKYNPVPVPIKYRRQYILSLRYLTDYIQSLTNRNFEDRLNASIINIFEMKRNPIMRAVATDNKYIADARFYSHLRWK